MYLPLYLSLIIFWRPISRTDLTETKGIFRTSGNYLPEKSYQSNAVCEELVSCHLCPHNMKRAEQTNNQQLFFHLRSEVNGRGKYPESQLSGAEVQEQKPFV